MHFFYGERSANTVTGNAGFLAASCRHRVDMRCCEGLVWHAMHALAIG
jgi:hypothetical protein